MIVQPSEEQSSLPGATIQQDTIQTSSAVPSHLLTVMPAEMLTSAGQLPHGEINYVNHEGMSSDDSKQGQVEYYEPMHMVQKPAPTRKPSFLNSDGETHRDMQYNVQLTHN